MVNALTIRGVSLALMPVIGLVSSLFWSLVVTCLIAGLIVRHSKWTEQLSNGRGEGKLLLVSQAFGWSKDEHNLVEGASSASDSNQVHPIAVGQRICWRQAKAPNNPESRATSGDLNSSLVAEVGRIVGPMFQMGKGSIIRDLMPSDGSLFVAGLEKTHSLTPFSGCDAQLNFDSGAAAKSSDAAGRFRELSNREEVAQVGRPGDRLAAAPLL